MDKSRIEPIEKVLQVKKANKRIRGEVRRKHYWELKRASQNEIK